MTLKFEPVPPIDTIRALRARGGALDPTFSWLDQWQQDHAAMFTVAKSAGYDILGDIFAALEQALSEGKTFRDFARELTPLLQAKGWWGRQLVTDPQTGDLVPARLGSARRLRTIFDTNMRVSYAAGHWASFERNKPRRPWLRYVALLDDATRRSHRARHNLVLPVDDPYWDHWAPPCGWNCRCTLQNLSDRDVDRLKREGERLVFDPPPLDFRPFVNKRTGEVTQVPDGIDPGWDYNPGKAGWRAVMDAAEAKIGSSEI
ncbi:phage minor head protein [Hoeflea sp.]|uniref:phage head morphogenesis protein n=1 Tax=Hoeflea sp. TaxID=1940281 RepID=UPI003BAFECEF